MSNGKQKYKIEGLREVQDALRKLPTKVKGKVLRNVNRKQAHEVKKSIIAAAPENKKSSKISFKRMKAGKNKGKLRTQKNSIKHNVKVNNDRTNTSGVLVGVTNRAYHARFIEKGTKRRVTRGRGKYRAGASRGSMTKRPFIEPTIDHKVPGIINKINNEYGDLVAKFLRKELRRFIKKSRT
jgi:HK97 gp10 family phage protein